MIANSGRIFFFVLRFHPRVQIFKPSIWNITHIWDISTRSILNDEIFIFKKTEKHKTPELGAVIGVQAVALYSALFIGPHITATTRKVCILSFYLCSAPWPVAPECERGRSNAGTVLALSPGIATPRNVLIPSRNARRTSAVPHVIALCPN